MKKVMGIPDDYAPKDMKTKQRENDLRFMK